MLPRTVLLDPSLATDLPLDITRSSAVNALAHCTGGVFAAAGSPVTDLLSTGGAQLLVAGLRRVVADPGDLTARARLAQGAHLAGTVLAHAGASAHHTICHVLGGAFDLPHAETHAAVLPAALAFLGERAPARAAVLGAALGGADPAATVGSLLAEVRASVRLRDIGLDEARLSQAARSLAAEVPGMTRARAARLLGQVW